LIPQADVKKSSEKPLLPEKLWGPLVALDLRKVSAQEVSNWAKSVSLIKMSPSSCAKRLACQD